MKKYTWVPESRFTERKMNKGKIEIEYYSKDELERIIDLFESIG